MASRKSKKPSLRRSTKRRKPKPSSGLKKPMRKRRKGKPGKNTVANATDPREIALSLMKKGLSQSAAAKSAGVSTQRLARYRKATTSSRKKGRKWVIADQRPSTMYLASAGKIVIVAVPSKYKSAVGRYWNAVNEFLTDNDPKYLRPYAGHSIRDIDRKKYIFETGPNTLRMLDSIGELDFIQIYANTAR